MGARKTGRVRMGWATRHIRRRAPMLALLSLPLLAGCAAEAPADEGGAAGSAEAVLGLADLRGTLEVAYDKFRQLAEAMPEETYDWAPMEGVRSVGDVFQHVAADNYFVPALMGFAAPAETGVTADPQTFNAFQAREMTKAEILEQVDASFVFLIESIDASASELDRAVSLGGTDTTVGDVWIRATVHLHEHLGQSIAYARSREVVPPWSR